MRILVALFLFSSFSAAAEPSQFINRSSDIFFPKELKEAITVNQNFPLFWWNFLVQENTSDSGTAEVNKLCDELKHLPPEMLERAECNVGLKEFQGIAKEWAADIVVRIKKPGNAHLEASMNQVLAQATLPSGDLGLIDLFRSDPLQSWQQLKEIAENRMPFHFERKNGFLTDPVSGRIVIPIQFHFSPSETKTTKNFEDRILAHHAAWIFIGSHASTVHNESQIKKDMARVSGLGLVMLIFAIVILLKTKRQRLILLFPVVFFGTFFSAMCTIACFGSIHGLTLSFGTGIIGLALDYGFQSSFNLKNPSVWKSNFCGLMTTIVGLTVLMFSSIPLLRQMMFFSIIGISTSFFVFYILAKRSWFKIDAAPIEIHFPPRAWKLLISALLLVSAVIGLLTVKPSLDMAQFDFQNEKSKAISMQMFQNSKIKPPLFEVHGSDPFVATVLEKNWADLRHIQVENISTYLPPPSVQIENLRSWQSGWSSYLKTLSSTQTRFFAPFLANSLSTIPFLPRAYVSHLFSEHKWITLWLPRSDAEESLIRKDFPRVTSLREVVSRFPKDLSQELGWMTPLSLVLAALVHLLYYRRLDYALIALLPFFNALGVIVLGVYIAHLQISFISIMGIVMVFGFSLDYGIFATDASIADQAPGHRTDEHTEGYWTGILFASFATIGGFLPLVFCSHPVLRQLGQTLFFGSIGTVLGAIWGIPSAVRLAQPSAKKANA